MLLEDPGVVKAICAAIIANRLPIPSVWMFLVGNSSGGKSKLLSSLSKVNGIYELDDLTPQTFLSGAKGKAGTETSLLHRLPALPILVLKDFTVLLAKDDTARGAIMGQLRTIYDGTFSKQYGTGTGEEWEGQVGFIAGTTTAVHTEAHKYAALGERFIMYNFEQPDRKEVTERAIRAMDDLVAQGVMREAFAEFLDSINMIPIEDIKFDKETYSDITRLAELSTRARSAVDRDKRTGDITMVHAMEMPIRLAKQLVSMGYGLVTINKNSDLESKLIGYDRKILYKIALDSIPQQRKQVMIELTKYQDSDQKSLGAAIGIPSDSVRRALEELRAFHVVDMVMFGNMIKWKMKEEYREILSTFESIEMTSKSLIDTESEPMPDDRDMPPPTRAEYQAGLMDELQKSFPGSEVV